LLTELLIARRRDAQSQRQNRGAEWREALGAVAQALGVDAGGASEPGGGQWQAAAAALQRQGLASPAAAARLFDGDAASDGAELLSLLSLMAGGRAGGPSGGGRERASAALVRAVAAAPGVVLELGGVRRAAEVLAALRTRAQLSPGETLAAVERCPPLLGFDPGRVRDNCLFLMGATASAEGAAAAAATGEARRRPLLGALALGAPAALGRPPAELRATWEFWVGGGPALAPEADLRRWPGALELEGGALRRRWALVSSSSAGRRRFDRDWAEMGPDALFGGSS